MDELLYVATRWRNVQEARRIGLTAAQPRGQGEYISRRLPDATAEACCRGCFCLLPIRSFARKPQCLCLGKTIQ